jgi:hypothetical protein
VSVIYYIYKGYKFNFRLLNCCLRRIELENTVVFYKLDCLRISVVQHERTNATNKALADNFYSCRLIVATFLSVTLCFSRVMMPKATYRWKGRIVTKVHMRRNSLNRKVERKEEKLL